MFLFDQGIWTTGNPLVPNGAVVRRARVYDGTPWAGLPIGDYLVVVAIQTANPEGCHVELCRLSDGTAEFPHNLWIKRP